MFCLTSLRVSQMPHFFIALARSCAWRITHEDARDPPAFPAQHPAPFLNRFPRLPPPRGQQASIHLAPLVCRAHPPPRPSPPRAGRSLAPRPATPVAASLASRSISHSHPHFPPDPPHLASHKCNSSPPLSHHRPLAVLALAHLLDLQCPLLLPQASGSPHRRCLAHLPPQLPCLDCLANPPPPQAPRLLAHLEAAARRVRPPVNLAGASALADPPPGATLACFLSPRLLPPPRHNHSSSSHSPPRQAASLAPLPILKRLPRRCPLVSRLLRCSQDSPRRQRDRCLAAAQEGSFPSPVLLP